jgi:putative spermidine/putrescine transport system permease protein
MRESAGRQPQQILRIGAVIAVIGMAVIPLALLVLWSLARAWFWPALLPREWSLRAWEYVISPSTDVFNAVSLSVGIAISVTLFALMVALPAARALALYEFRGKRLMLFALLLPVLSPPLAATMGMHAIFLRYRLTDTVIGVVLAHLVPAVPYTTLMLAGSFSRLDPDLESQARTLGASRLKVWRHVTIPAILPGLAVAASFAFLISLSQYLTTLLIGGGRIITLPLSLVAFQRSGDEAVTAALSIVFLVSGLTVLGMVARLMSSKNSGSNNDV